MTFRQTSEKEDCKGSTERGRERKRESSQAHAEGIMSLLSSGGPSRQGWYWNSIDEGNLNLWAMRTVKKVKGRSDCL
jgi:hypothetical protein